jgi:hypothetical protein
MLTKAGIKVGRNAPCPCGSGLKYKKCCLQKTYVQTGKEQSIKESSVQEPHSTTPMNITKPIKRFIKTLGSVGTPEYLPFTYSSERYKSKHCLSNCEAEFHFSGDPIIYGWIIWENNKIDFIEAEFHAVIKRSNKYIDITPRVDNEDKVLFVPDFDRKATRLNNREWNTWKNHRSLGGRIESSTQPTIITNIYDDKLF